MIECISCNDLICKNCSLMDKEKSKCGVDNSSIEETRLACFHIHMRKNYIGPITTYTPEKPKVPRRKVIRVDEVVVDKVFTAKWAILECGHRVSWREGEDEVYCYSCPEGG